MPFIKRLVALDNKSASRCGLRLAQSDCSWRHDEVEVRAGDALIRVCRLLACLAQHADGLFQDLLDECRQVADRTKRLDDRLRGGGLVDRVAQLDARTAARRTYPTTFLPIFICCNMSEGLSLAVVAVASLPALGPLAPPSRTGPLARKYLPGFRYSTVNLCEGNKIITHTHPFNGPFSKDYPGGPVPER